MLRGIAYGLVAASAWASYNVGAKLGTAEGFGAADLSVLRFAVSGVLLLPVLLVSGLPPIGIWRNVLLAMSAGPLFALAVNAGFTLAPLSHGVVFGPGSVLLLTMLLAWFIDGERPGRPQLAGSAILALGLVAIAVDGWHGGGGTGVLLGDLAFVTAGLFWGAFTALLKRWHLDALPATATVAVFSAAIFAPAYVLLGGGMDFPPASIAMQGFYQGVLGGCVGVLAYAGTVSQLGAGKAALFPAVVPALAVLIAVPALHEVPTPIELLGIALCTLGLLTALGVFGALGRRFR